MRCVYTRYSPRNFLITSTNNDGILMRMRKKAIRRVHVSTSYNYNVLYERYANNAFPFYVTVLIHEIADQLGLVGKAILFFFFFFPSSSSLVTTKDFTAAPTFFLSFILSKSLSKSISRKWKSAKKKKKTRRISFRPFRTRQIIVKEGTVHLSPLFLHRDRDRDRDLVAKMGKRHTTSKEIDQ